MATNWTCTVTSNTYGTGGLNPNGTVGNGTTTWITGPNPQSIAVDMQTARTIIGFQIVPNQNNAIGQGYTLDISDDGTTWTSTGETISGLPAVVATQSWKLSASYTHRYFRINVTADNGFVSMQSLALYSQPVASSINTPISDAGAGSKHQLVKAPSFTPPSSGGGNYGYSG
jgi:hypothetical protein